MNNYMIINAQNNFLHNFCVHVCCVITQSFLKQSDLNITEFFTRNPIISRRLHIFGSGLPQDPSDKKANYLIWKYSLGSTLQFALFKIKIILLGSDQKCLRHGSSTKPFVSLCKRDNTITPRKKHFFFLNKFTIELWTS